MLESALNVKPIGGKLVIFRMLFKDENNVENKSELTSYESLNSHYASVLASSAFKILSAPDGVHGKTSSPGSTRIFSRKFVLIVSLLESGCSFRALRKKFQDRNPVKSAAVPALQPSPRTADGTPQT